MDTPTPTIATLPPFIPRKPIKYKPRVLAAPVVTPSSQTLQTPSPQMLVPVPAEATLDRKGAAAADNAGKDQ